jgi:hypothetical protein
MRIAVIGNKRDNCIILIGEENTPIDESRIKNPIKVVERGINK